MQLIFALNFAWRKASDRAHWIEVVSTATLLGVCQCMNEFISKCKILAFDMDLQEFSVVTFKSDRLTMFNHLIAT